MLTAVETAIPVGFITLHQQSACSWEIHAIGVLPDRHRRGVGRRLLAEAERWLDDHDAEFLTVKTLSSSAESAPYERTHAFYAAMGFRPLLELPTLWSPENPCLVMIKPLASPRSHRLFSDRRLVIASHNAGKAREIAELLSPFGVEVISAASLKLQSRRTETTFVGNAELKARAAAAASHLPAWPTIPGSWSTRSTARRHLLGTLGRATKFLRRHGPRAAGLETTKSPTDAPTSSPRSLYAGPTATASHSRVGSTARWYGRRAAPADSAMIPCSCPTATTSRSARWSRGQSTPSAIAPTPSAS